MHASVPNTSKPSPITIGLSACTDAFTAVGILTGLINVLMLTGLRVSVLQFRDF